MNNNVTILVDFDYTLFDTARFAEFLLSSPKTINYKDFLYPDALGFIRYASDFGNLVLFSEGEAVFQKEKIDGTEIGKLFSGGVKILPSYSKKQDLAEFAIKGKTILIDDKPEIADEGISLGYRVIRVKRGKYASEDTNNKPDFVVKSLSEIVSGNILQSI